MSYWRKCGMWVIRPIFHRNEWWIWHRIPVKHIQPHSHMLYSKKAKSCSLVNSQQSFFPLITQTTKYGLRLTLIKNSNQAAYHKENSLNYPWGNLHLIKKAFIDFLLCESYCAEHHMNQHKLDNNNNVEKKYGRMISGLTSYTDKPISIFHQAYN